MNEFHKKNKLNERPIGTLISGTRFLAMASMLQSCQQGL